MADELCRASPTSPKTRNTMKTKESFRRKRWPANPIKTVERSIEITVAVSGKYHPEVGGSFYRSNGDPGDPPEPAEFEIHKVTFAGVDITEALDASGFDWSSLEDTILDDCEED